MLPIREDGKYYSNKIRDGHGHDRWLILFADAQDQIVFVMLNPLSKKRVGGWVRVFSDVREVSLWSAAK